MKSVKELAQSLGLSSSTVYDALRGNPRVKVQTRDRILEAAKAAGFQYNPLVGSLMSEVRRARASTFRGVVAVVDLESPKARPDKTEDFQSALRRGAKKMGEQLGFKVELFVLGQEGITVARLDSILKSRGIRGLLILPAKSAPDISELNWSEYAGVYTDCIIEKPALDSVCPDHFRAMTLALSKAKELGYRRPGFVLQADYDQRLLYRWEAAFRSFGLHHEGFDWIEPYTGEKLYESEFKSWFEANKPDLILSHRIQIKAWMERLGAKIPETHGFCKINITTSPEPVSGLYLCPLELGQRAMQLLIGKLHRNDYGIPSVQLTSMASPVWVDGPTMRQMQASG
ncbi:LacI family DNA-binding transcriptional regulator [Pelagicoccus albus]|uniref:LacI family DNA-binding transcriptional regulator n=1 Tax=Pelagicoccus albus TaxID=415222 RepID=A0A7X1B3J9_9BACT|nr:LacI family DNA-binding transcriptional regulator [Pelagicoccus albus]MBC2604994.1 LacI family DNA-binding transcriptional regulator [Pelagicoccus albus]